MVDEHCYSDVVGGLQLDVAAADQNVAVNGGSDVNDTAASVAFRRKSALRYVLVLSSAVS